MKEKTGKLTAAGMLCALAYASTAVGRVPLVLFLKYDPKDSVIAAGGLLLGPLAALAVTVVVSCWSCSPSAKTACWAFS